MYKRPLRWVLQVKMTIPEREELRAFTRARTVKTATWVKRMIFQSIRRRRASPNRKATGRARSARAAAK